MDELQIPRNLDREAVRQIAARHRVEMQRLWDAGEPWKELSRAQFSELERIVGTADQEAKDAFFQMYLQEQRLWSDARWEAEQARINAEIQEESRRAEQAERASEEAQRAARKLERERDLVSVERLLAVTPRSTKSVNDLGRVIGNVWELVGALAVLAAFGALVFWIYTDSIDSNSRDTTAATSSISSTADMPIVLDRICCASSLNH